MKKLLLHTCCVSCLSYVHKKLAEKDFLPVVFYYNPQMNDKTEYLNRLKDIETYCKNQKLELVVPEFIEKEFSKPINPWQDEKSLKYINDKNRFKRKRCEFCYELRIEKTSREAKKRRIKYFSSTTLCSPYQDHEFVDYIADQKSKEYNLTFIYEDFRKGYWQGRNYGRNHKYMIPSYCGCVFSIAERMLE